jgi:two-component system OmpR family sensor kinase
VNHLRGVRLRLSLAFLAVVALTLGAVALVILPSLRNALVSSKLGQLERAMPAVIEGAGGQQDAVQLSDFLDAAAGSANARVVIYDLLRAAPPAVSVFADSVATGSAGMATDRTVLRAIAERRLVRGTVVRAGSRYAEVAKPAGSYVFLLSSPLAEADANLAVVQQRLLLAALIGLGVAAVIGYLAASAAARRLQRLERSADRIAGGCFDEPVIDGGADEIGELAVAFDRMRLRLAQLENARREFIANASHELRTPLFALGGSLELLTDEELDEETRRDFLLTMRQQVDRLTKLATELLDLSRLDAGRIEVQRVPVELWSVAEAVVAELQAVAAASGHTLAAEPTGVVVAAADEERVRQILRGLVDNAIRHTPAGSHVVLRVGQEGSRATVAVEDDGPGIAQADAEHVFERFYRAAGGRASGSGLGLAIARELALVMDGVVELDSRPGRTVFTLALPVAADPVYEPARPVPVEA